MNKSKVAIIGASTGQIGICKKARELGIETICFAWEQGAVCKNLVDKFYPISIKEMDEIANICEQENVNGVMTNASHICSEVVAYVSQKLNLVGNDYQMYVNARDKAFIRDCSKDIEGLSSTKYVMFDGLYPKSYPCVVKPTVGGGKKGVNFVRNKADFDRLVENNLIDEHYMIEEFIDGREFSIESISYKGNHYVIQITDKDSLGYPHFVEIGHHQPSTLPDEVKDRIKKVVPQLLTACNYQNGPTHIEMKLTQSGELHLIEINLRGGGGEISSQLVQLSTGYDYVKAMIDVALDRFEVPEVRDFAHSGIYFLCNQTKQYLNFFKSADKQLWLVDKNIKSYDLIESTSNWDRNGYIIYRSDHKILPK